MSILGTAGDLGYPDHLLIAGGAAGTQDPATGVWTPGVSAAAIYDGPADVQDTGGTLRRDPMGRLVESWAVEAFLPPEAAMALRNIRPEQVCTITWADGIEATAEVVRARHIDGVVELRQVALI